MKRFAILGSKIIPATDAVIPITDLGLVRGYGVFDVAIAFYDRVHRMDDHLRRFFSSADFLGLQSPYSQTKITSLTYKLLKTNRYPYSSIKWVITGGKSQDGKIVDKPTFFILNEPAKNYPSAYYTKGVKIITADHAREFPTIKSTNYQFAFLHYPRLQKSGAFELIYAPKKNVLEGLTSNIFIVKKNIIITPQDDILQGITRKEVIEIALSAHIPVKKRPVSQRELYNADEVFITASLKKVMPVVIVDNKTIASGAPGKLTKKIIRLHRLGLLGIRYQQRD